MTYDPQSAALSMEKQMLIPFSLSGYICSLGTVTPNIRLPVNKQLMLVNKFLAIKLRVIKDILREISFA